jgi:hypothetical protein
MTIYEFIDANRAELEQAINTRLNFVPKTASCNCYQSGTDHVHPVSRTLDDEALRQWIYNDEGLYNWARQEGVRI